MSKGLKKVDGRGRRKIRVRKKIFGTGERLRLSVFRSSAHIYAQVIDDTAGKTVVSSSSVEKSIADALQGKNKSEAASEVGKILAKRCAEKGIDKVAFDRNGYRYHGRIAAVAIGAREGGLQF